MSTLSGLGIAFFFFVFGAIVSGVFEEIVSVPIANSLRGYGQKQYRKFITWNVARSDSAARKRLKSLNKRLSSVEKVANNQNALIAMVGVQVTSAMVYFGWVAFMLLALAVIEAEAIEDNKAQIVDTLRAVAFLIFVGTSLLFFRLGSIVGNLFLNILNYDQFSTETLEEIKELEARLGIDADDEADDD